MSSPSRKRITPYLKAAIAILMIALWTLVAFSGFTLWQAPSGPRSGWNILLLDWTKHEWGEVHFWLSNVALLITLIHVALDWRPLMGYIRYITSSKRAQSPASLG